jgi:hypothetical protein
MKVSPLIITHILCTIDVLRINQVICLHVYYVITVMCLAVVLLHIYSYCMHVWCMGALSICLKNVQAIAITALLRFIVIAVSMFMCNYM